MHLSYIINTIIVLYFTNAYRHIIILLKKIGFTSFQFSLNNLNLFIYKSFYYIMQEKLLYASVVQFYTLNYLG